MLEEIDRSVYYERILGTAVKYLIENSHTEEALELAKCEITLIQLTFRYQDYDQEFYDHEVHLASPMVALKKLRLGEDTYWHNEDKDPFRLLVEEALLAVIPPSDTKNVTGIWLKTSAILIDGALDWRSRLAEWKKNPINNQNIFALGKKNAIIYDRLSFNSPPEVEIAKELDKRGILYFANCPAKLGEPGKREIRFPDFVVFYDGKWGILEVDGEQFHSGMAAKDHQRDRIFKSHGIKTIEHYTAKECMENPYFVINGFLSLLSGS